MQVLASFRKEAALKRDQQEREQLRIAIEAVNSSGERMSLPQIAKKAQVSRSMVARVVKQHTDVARVIHKLRRMQLEKRKLPKQQADDTAASTPDGF